MADSGKPKPKQKPFNTNTPLNSKTLRDWVEHFASQLAKSDAVEIILTEDKVRDGDNMERRVTSHKVSPNYNICPMRHGERNPEIPPPKPPPGGGGG